MGQCGSSQRQPRPPGRGGQDSFPGEWTRHRSRCWRCRVPLPSRRKSGNHTHTHTHAESTLQRTLEKAHQAGKRRKQRPAQTWGHENRKANLPPAGLFHTKGRSGGHRPLPSFHLAASEEGRSPVIPQQPFKGTDARCTRILPRGSLDVEELHPLCILMLPHFQAVPGAGSGGYGEGAPAMAPHHGTDEVLVLSFHLTLWSSLVC